MNVMPGKICDCLWRYALPLPLYGFFWEVKMLISYTGKPFIPCFKVGFSWLAFDRDPATVWTAMEVFQFEQDCLRSKPKHRCIRQTLQVAVRVTYAPLCLAASKSASQCAEIYRIISLWYIGARPQKTIPYHAVPFAKPSSCNHSALTTSTRCVATANRPSPL